MACIIVPTTVGVMTTVFRKNFPEGWHINWLNAMFFGGAIALGIEHVAHGEIVPWPPFLTAMSNPADTAAMLGEMASVGIPMTLALILVWAVMVFAYEKLIVARRLMAHTRHKLDLLALMLLGTLILVLVDRTALDMLLILLMVVPLFVVWMIAAFTRIDEFVGC